MSLYVAYGSNLNVQQMSYRCPGATVAFTGYLINWKLLYRGSHTGSYAIIVIVFAGTFPDTPGVTASTARSMVSFSVNVTVRKVWNSTASI